MTASLTPSHVRREPAVESSSVADNDVSRSYTAWMINTSPSEKYRLVNGQAAAKLEGGKKRK
jgi:hypothetical protein